MTLERPLLVGGGIAATCLLAAAFIGGRCSAPAPRVEERQVTDGKRDASWGSTSTMAKRVERRRAPTVRERYSPSGALVERLTLGEVTTTTAVDAGRTATAAVHETVRVETVRVVEPASAPRLRLSIAAEWKTSDLHLQPEFRAGADLRISGPLWLSASVSPPVLGQALDVRFGPTLILAW